MSDVLRLSQQVTITLLRQDNYEIDSKQRVCTRGRKSGDRARERNRSIDGGVILLPKEVFWILKYSVKMQPTFRSKKTINNESNHSNSPNFFIFFLHSFYISHNLLNFQNCSNITTWFPTSNMTNDEYQPFCRDGSRIAKGGSLKNFPHDDNKVLPL